MAKKNKQIDEKQHEMPARAHEKQREREKNAHTYTHLILLLYKLWFEKRKWKPDEVLYQIIVSQQSTVRDVLVLIK